jgi:hypothetical protein
VDLNSLLDSYKRLAENAGVVPLLDESDISVFCPSQQVRDREKWDPGVGSSWEAVPKGGGWEGAKVEAQKSGERPGRERGGVAGHESACSDFEGGDAALVKTGGKRKRPRGAGSRLSRKRGGKDLRLAGSNAASRKARIRDKWTAEGTFYRTGDYSLLNDGSHSSTGWQGLAPPIQKRRDVLEAYRDGSITALLGSFFPVPYQPWVYFETEMGFANCQFVT